MKESTTKNQSLQIELTIILLLPQVELTIVTPHNFNLIELFYNWNLQPTLRNS